MLVILQIARVSTMDEAMYNRTNMIAALIVITYYSFSYRLSVYYIIF